MKLGTIVIAGVLAFGAVAGAEPPPVYVGTWKLDLARSKYDPGPPPRSVTQTIEAVDGGMRQVSDSVGADGKAGHSEYTAAFDGKDHPIQGNPRADSISIRKVDERTFEWAMKKGGAVVESGRTVYSADGKTRTQVYTGAGADGRRTSVTAVYVRQ